MNGDATTREAQGGTTAGTAGERSAESHHVDGDGRRARADRAPRRARGRGALEAAAPRRAAGAAAEVSEEPTTKITREQIAAMRRRLRARVRRLVARAHHGGALPVDGPMRCVACAKLIPPTHAIGIEPSWLVERRDQRRNECVYCARCFRRYFDLDPRSYPRVRCWQCHRRFWYVAEKRERHYCTPACASASTREWRAQRRVEPGSASSAAANFRRGSASALATARTVAASRRIGSGLPPLRIGSGSPRRWCPPRRLGCAHP